MRTKTAVSMMCAALALGTPLPASAQDPSPHYTKMAPIEQYLMDRDAEIALARTGAPESITQDAEILVLTRNGYEVAVKGTNGFVCDVDRGWTSDFDYADFMNPTVREPVCYNAVAAKALLPRVFKLTELALAGQDAAQMSAAIKTAYDKKELPLPESGAMSFMMSKQMYFGPKFGYGSPHVMFYYPKTDSLSWGAGLPGSPVIVHQDSPEPWTTFVILVLKYSDGSPAPGTEVHGHCCRARSSMDR